MLVAPSLMLFQSLTRDSVGDDLRCVICGENVYLGFNRSLAILLGMTVVIHVYLTSADVSGAQTLVSDDGQIFTARSGAFSVKIKGLQGMTMFAM